MTPGPGLARIDINTTLPNGGPLDSPNADADQDILLEMDTSPLWINPLVQRSLGLPTFDFASQSLEGMDPRVIEAAQLSWEERCRSEYLGVLIFRHLHDLLIDLNAPLDIQQVAIALMAHENHHTLACSWAATHLGGGDGYVFELDELQLKRSAAPLTEQLVYQVVTVLCCGEVVAYDLLKHTVKALPPGPYKAVLERILKDEVLHSRVGFSILKQLKEERFCPWPGDDLVRKIIHTYMAGLRQRDVVDPDEAALFEVEALIPQLLALGVPPTGPFKACYHDAIPGSFAQGFADIGISI